VIAVRVSAAKVGGFGACAFGAVALVLLLAGAWGTANAASAYLPLVSAGATDNDPPQFDGIAVIGLPTMQTIRILPVAQPAASGLATVRPDGALVAVLEPAGTLAVYDGRTGSLRDRWPSPPCGIVSGNVNGTWHPTSPNILIVSGVCFFDVATGVTLETPATLGLSAPLFTGYPPTVSDGGRYLVVPRVVPPSTGALQVRVIDLEQPRNGRDFAAQNGVAVIAFDESTLLSQVSGTLRYTDLATSADLGPVPMADGWRPSPPYRALADGSIVATAFRNIGEPQRLIRLRNRTLPGEFIATLSSYTFFQGLEIGPEFALVRDGPAPGCVITPPIPCVYGPTRITAIELSSGRSYLRTLPNQKVATIQGTFLASGGVDAIPVPITSGGAGIVLILLLLALAAIASLKLARRVDAKR